MKEKWKNAKSILKVDYIWVSNYGRVYSTYHTKNRMLIGKKLSQKGYKRVNVAGHVYFVHQLVAKLWVNTSNNNNKLFVNHIDGNKLNNNFTNLEWVTSAENTAHAKNLGLLAQRHKGNTKYSCKTVQYVIDGLKNGKRQIDLAKELKINKRMIQKWSNQTFCCIPHSKLKGISSGQDLG